MISMYITCYASKIIYQIKMNPSSITIYVDSQDSKDEDYLCNYHYSEIYEPTIFTAQIVTEYYGYGFLPYTYKILTIVRNFKDINDPINKKYIVAELVLSDIQYKELSKYCQCEYHKMWNINPFKYITCKCCVGCLESYRKGNDVVNETIQYTINELGLKFDGDVLIKDPTNYWSKSSGMRPQ